MSLERRVNKLEQLFPPIDPDKAESARLWATIPESDRGTVAASYLRLAVGGWEAEAERRGISVAAVQADAALKAEIERGALAEFDRDVMTPLRRGKPADAVAAARAIVGAPKPGRG